MGDFVSDGTEFSCPLCTTKLKIAVPSSSASGDSKTLATTTNNLFPPPPGGQCLLCPSAPVPCVPNVSNIDPGQTAMQIDDAPALGSGCKFMCAKGGMITVSSPGQSEAQHDGASAADTAIEFILTIALAILSRGRFKGGILKNTAKTGRAVKIPKNAGASKNSKSPSPPPNDSAPKQRNKPPPPDPKAQGRPHTIIEKPGKNGQYTTHNGDGTYKQYRGSGKDHGPIPRPNVKENKLNHSPKGPIPGKPEVRPARPDEIPK